MKEGDVVAAQEPLWRNMVDFLGETLGSSFEAVLFDLQQADLPAVYHRNATQASIGAMRELVQQALTSEWVRRQGYCVNRGISLDFSQMLKTSVLFLPGEKEEDPPPAALCVAVHCGMFLRLMNLASEMISLDHRDLDSTSPEELVVPRKESPSLEMIDRILAQQCIDPATATQGDRIEAIVELYEAGVFEIKGAVAKTAEALGISQKSVYRYLAKIKQARS